MQLTSAAFGHGSDIPTRFTCEGENSSPEFSWRDAPAGAKSFVLIMHDPDAPRPGGFTHWVLYNIPPGVAALDPNIPTEERITGIGVHGKNDSGKIGYTGPCPPSGTHRYVTRLYALDTEVALDPGASHTEVQAAMRGHVLEQAELMGKYAKRSAKVA